MFPYYTPKNLFFAELIGKNFHLPINSYIPLAFGCLFLIWLSAGLILKNKLFPYLTILIVVLSPWIYYLTMALSFYIYLLLLSLTIINGLLLLQTGKQNLGTITLIIGSTLALYSSVVFWILLPLVFVTLVGFKIVTLKALKYPIFFILVLGLPLLFLANKNRVGLKNSLNREMAIYTDPGLMNTINRYQGAAGKNGFKTLAKISENKYLFFTEYTFQKYLIQIVPETYFTPKYKLLGFSFSPPIFLGFLIPLIYGLYLVLKKPSLRKVLLISTILTVPSIIANNLVALNRLILFSPILFVIIAYGLMKLYQNRKERLAKIFLLLTTFLVLFQLFVTIDDIRVREGKRFDQNFGTKYELFEP
jgi:hypothetical protein